MDVMKKVEELKIVPVVKLDRAVCRRASGSGSYVQDGCRRGIHPDYEKGIPGDACRGRNGYES